VPARQVPAPDPRGLPGAGTCRNRAGARERESRRAAVTSVSTPGDVRRGERGKAARRGIFARSFPGERAQVRRVRAAIAPLLDGCPFADDAVLIVSELAANAAVHSRSAAAGGQFTARAEIYAGEYVWIGVEDQGGPWAQNSHDDGRPHGLDLVAALAGAGNWGIDGDAEHGRTVWARLNWPR
jgi:hypothetical protein